jgi:Flp pilus assembly protein TadG
MKLNQLLRALRTDQRGNVLMIFGFSLIPMVFATGMGIDYARAMKAQTKLNAAADAAALSAVSQTMMNESNAAACDKAQKMFAAQANALPGVKLAEDAPVISMKDADGVVLKCKDASGGGASQSRTVTVTYTGTSDNIFGGLLGWAALPISGASDTYASVAPNIDFYIALDTSPSMALPTTSAGITTMENKLGCAFACHSNQIEKYVTPRKNKHIADTIFLDLVKGNYGTGSVTEQGSCKKTSGGKCTEYNYDTYTYTVIDQSGHYVFDNKPYKSGVPLSCNVDGKDKCVRNPTPNTYGEYADSYWYALNKGLTLRVTDERFAVRDLMDLAVTYAVDNEADYRAALYTFDHSTNLKRIASLSENLTGTGGVKDLTSGVDLVIVNDKKGNGRPPNGASGSEYLFTSFQSILQAFSPGGAYPIPDPGLGTKTSGDKPQAFLFMVTDGMSDENIGSGRTRAAMQQAQINQCNALKARKIKIAILYTEYTYESIKSDEPGQREIARKAIQGDGQKSVAQALTECASPGLMYTVKTDESISNALQSLFSKALAAARIIR